MWAGTSTFRIGDWHVGVRSSRVEVHELLRRALAAHRAEDVQAPANYSLRFPGDDDEERGGPRQLHVLYRSSTPIARARAGSPVLHGLLSHLSSLLDAPADDLLQLKVLALVRDGRAVLAPRDLISHLARLDPWLERAGLHLVPAPHVCVDPASAELVVAPVRLEVDALAVAELGLELRAPEVVEPGRYRIRAWVFDTGAPPAPVPEAPALAWALPTVEGLPALGVTRAAHDVRRLLQQVQPVSAATWSPRARAHQLADLTSA